MMLPKLDTTCFLSLRKAFPSHTETRSYSKMQLKHLALVLIYSYVFAVNTWAHK